MSIIGEKIRVKATGQIGVVTEIRGNNELCVEFDGCAATQTLFALDELDIISPADDPSANVDIIQADKGL